MQPTPASPNLALVCDADNTLWDTDQVYANAQLWLLEEMERRSGLHCSENDRLDYVREIDQAIAKRHHTGLRYPSVLLVAGLRKTLAGMPVNRAATDSIHEGGRGAEDQGIAIRFDTMLKNVPPLRPGVKNGLRRIHDLGVPVLVATEGSAESCRSRLTHWKLTGFVHHVLSAPKSRELYERASKLLKLPPTHCIVVGDQLDKDIVLATSAGCATIYFPGGFSPKWLPSVSQAKPSYVVDTFEEVANILATKIKESDTSHS